MASILDFLFGRGAPSPSTLPQVAPQGDPGQPAPQPAFGGPAVPPASNDMRALPVAPVHSALTNFFDRNLLGGAIAEHDRQALTPQIAAYHFNQAKQFADTLPLDQQRLFWADPEGYIKGLDTPVTQKPSETTLFGGPTGSKITAPNFDPDSGLGYQLGQGGSVSTTGQGIGPQFKTENGVVLAGRQGPVAAYSLPQIVPAGSRPGAFTPAVTPPGAPLAAGLPQLSAPRADAAAPAGMPTLSTLPAILPGARLTSGYRTPAHNADVGGVPGSWHTAGTPVAPDAMDLAPPPGVPMGQFASTVAAKLPQLRVLNEGDHIHVQPNAKNTGSSALPQQGDAAPGWNVGAAAPIYSGQRLNPATGKYEQVNAATGEVSDKGAPPFSVPQVLEMRKSFQDSEVAKTANAATYALNSLRGALGKSTKNNGVIDMAAIMNLSKSETGGVPRQGQVKTILDHFGLPQDIENRIMSTTGNGALTPESLRQVMDMLESYTTSSRSIAQQRLDNDEALAKGYGHSLKLALPDITPMPNVSWMGDNAPPAAAPTHNTPPPPVGFVNKRGLKYVGGDPLSAKSWAKAVGQ